jgi:tyrosine-protein phosphatase SIW14
VGRLHALVLFFAVVGVDAPGVPNFHQVTDGFYRGGQPTAQGFRSLKNLGVQTVLDLRIPAGQSKWEKKMVEDLGMKYIHLPMHGNQTPTQSDIDQIFSLLNDTSRWPLFVHCREGKDRTGMVVGCYRISHDGWTNLRALAEAKSYASRELTHAMEKFILNFHPSSTTTSKPAPSGGKTPNAIK